MTVESEKNYPTTFVSYDELHVAMALAMGESDAVGGVSSDIQDSLVQKGLIHEGALSEDGRTILQGVSTGQGLIEIVLITPDGFTSTTAFNGPEHSTILTNQGENEFRLMGMPRADMIYHCADALQLLTLSMRNSIDLQFPEGFLADMLTRQPDTIRQALKGAQGADQEFRERVEADEWSIRTMSSVRDGADGSEKRDFLLVVRVGARTFFVSPQPENGVHAAYTVPPMIIWSEMSQWFNPAS